MATEKPTFWGGCITSNLLANNRCGAYTSMPWPLFGARDVCHIEKKVAKLMRIFLGRQACNTTSSSKRKAKKKFGWVGDPELFPNHYCGERMVSVALEWSP